MLENETQAGGKLRALREWMLLDGPAWAEYGHSNSFTPAISYTYFQNTLPSINRLTVLNTLVTF